MNKKSLLSIVISVFGVACAPKGFESIEKMASQTVNDIACKDQQLEEKLFDGLKTYLLEQKSLPDASQLKVALREKLNAQLGNSSNSGSVDFEKIALDLDQLVEILLEETLAGERIESPEQLLLLLSAIDVGDRTTGFRSYMQDKVRGKFRDLGKTIQALNFDCPTPPAVAPAPVEEETSVAADFEYHRQKAIDSGTTLAAFGGRWAFATAYQSCQSEQLPAMNSQTPGLEGIKIVGKHPDGVGNKRLISSLSDVQRTHYYIRDANNFGQGCFDVRANPLIYDYGGKPFASTAASSPIDLFKNNGDGTSVLGIDCSGYVFTAMAAAGLKLKMGRALKASDAWAWGSTAYVEPQNNGLTCLNKIAVTSSKSLQAGDIVAVQGHVLLIDKVGADPFGISRAKNENDCARLNSDGFDFTVAQSAPSKGGIGINYFEARDYLPTSSKMKAGLEKYASYTCLAKIKNKSYVPNLGTLSVVRHKGSADCIAPRVKLAKESCIQSCSSLVR